MRSKEVAPATVNRGIAVLSNMLTFALDKGHIDVHPMQKFKRLPEPETVLRVLTLEEERRLVEAVMLHDPVIGAYCGILGETGLRMMEGLRLKWEHISIPHRNLTVQASKNYKTREIPCDSTFRIATPNPSSPVRLCERGHSRGRQSARPAVIPGAEGREAALGRIP